MHNQFRCRHCCGLVYASKYEHPRLRMFQRVRRLHQRLGITGKGVPEKPRGMPVHTYERLLDAALRAEIQASEAGTARLQRLLAWVESRRGPRKPPRRSFRCSLWIS
jgi:hypothetical protein